MDINITTGIYPTGQLPLDSKAYAKTLTSLSDLGDNNHKAYYYYEGLIVYSIEDKLFYEWREEKVINETNGLVVPSFTYPINLIQNEINYSERTFNFFLKQMTKEEIKDFPTKSSDFENDGADGASTYAEHDELGAVATSNSYNDLDDKPTKTSDFTNDGEDGVPFIITNEIRIIKHPLNNDPLKIKVIEPYDKVENLWLPDNKTLIESGVFLGADIYNVLDYRQDDLITNIIEKP